MSSCATPCCGVSTTARLAAEEPAAPEPEDEEPVTERIRIPRQVRSSDPAAQEARADEVERATAAKSFPPPLPESPPESARVPAPEPVAAALSTPEAARAGGASGQTRGSSQVGPRADHRDHSKVAAGGCAGRARFCGARVGARGFHPGRTDDRGHGDRARSGSCARPRTTITLHGCPRADGGSADGTGAARATVGWLGHPGCLRRCLGAGRGTRIHDRPSSGPFLDRAPAPVAPAPGGGDRRRGRPRGRAGLRLRRSRSRLGARAPGHRTTRSSSSSTTASSPPERSYPRRPSGRRATPERSTSWRSKRDPWLPGRLRRPISALRPAQPPAPARRRAPRHGAGRDQPARRQGLPLRRCRLPNGDSHRVDPRGPGGTGCSPRPSDAA